MKLFRQILAISLAFLVMGSTVSFAANMHYCGSFLVDINLLEAATSCGMDNFDTSKTTDTEGCTIEKSNCCKDKKIIVDGQDELSSPLQLTLEQQVFIVSFGMSYLALFTPEVTDNPDYLTYTPPKIVWDIQQLQEVYLI